ncbi:MAG: nucleotidyltransferase domain-containing protein [Anaerolineae bacterium]|nr:nucleotidyltransferase domain-containing protein [Anaerolineae bacterium]
MARIDIEAARRYYYKREARRRAQREAERQRWLERARHAIRRIAERYPGVRRVYLFGSITQPGRFGERSDIDIAVECEDLETESAFWHALELELQRTVDLRPLTGAIAQVVTMTGEQVYEREDMDADQ